MYYNKYKEKNKTKEIIGRKNNSKQKMVSSKTTNLVIGYDEQYFIIGAEDISIKKLGVLMINKRLSTMKIKLIFYNINSFEDKYHTLDSISKEIVSDKKYEKLSTFVETLFEKQKVVANVDDILGLKVAAEMLDNLIGKDILNKVKELLDEV